MILIFAALRARVVPLRIAVAVSVLGGIGPFFGSYEFVREERRRAALGDPAQAGRAAGSSNARLPAPLHRRLPAPRAR